MRSLFLALLQFWIFVEKFVTLVQFFYNLIFLIIWVSQGTYYTRRGLAVKSSTEKMH